MAIGLGIALFCIVSQSAFAFGPVGDVQSMAAEPQPTAPRDEDPIKSLLKSHGGYPLSREEAAQIQKTFQEITNGVNPNPAKRISVTYIHSPSVNAFVYRSNKGDKAAIFHGVFRVAQDVDELAAVLAHEANHTRSYDTRKTEWERYLQSTREEIITADRGAMEMMLKNGYDPRALRRVLIRLGEDTSYEAGGRLAIGSHPSNSLRLTAVDSWLSAHENKLPKELKRPFPALIEKLIGSPPKSKSVKRVEAPKPPPPPPPPPDFERAKPEPHPGPYHEYAFSEVLAGMEKSPKYQALPPKEKLEILARMDSVGGLQESAHRYLNPKIPANPRWESYVDNRWLKFVHGITFRGLDDKDYLQLLERIAALPDTGDPNLADRKIGAIDFLWERGHVSRDAAAQHQNLVCPLPPFRNLGEFNAAIDYAYQKKIRWGAAQKDLALQKIWEAASPQERLAIFESWPGKNYALLSRELTESYGKYIGEVYELAIQAGKKSVVVGEKWLGNEYPDQWFSEARERHYEPNKGELLYKSLSDPRISTVERLAIVKISGDAKVNRKSDSERLKDSLPRILKNELKDFATLQKVRAELSQARAEKTYSVTLSAKDLLQAIDLHPEWKLSVEDVMSITQDEDFWEKSWVSERVSKALQYTSTANSTQKAKELLEKQGKGALSPFLETGKGGLTGPGYQYSPDEARRLQTLLVENLRAQGKLPTEPLRLHQLLLSLAEKGSTPALDAWAAKVYLDDNFTCQNCLEETLEKLTVSDLDFRKKIYDKWLSQRATLFTKTPHHRVLRINREVERLSRFFPEESLARAQALEGFANRIQANHAETKIIEAAKFSGNANVEAVVLRLLDGILGKVRLDHRKHGRPDALSPLQRQLQFILFLQGKKELHLEIKRDFFGEYTDKRISEHFITEEQLQRYFSTLTPSLKALALNPMLTGPHGIYREPEGRKALIDLATEEMGEYRPQAKLLFEALLHGLQEVSPFQETLAVAYILGQGGGAKQPPGLRLRNALASMGNSGTSIGQKLYQRRLVPPEFLPYLRDFQDAAKNTARIKIFERIAQVLGEPDLDDVMILEDKLGEASSKLVAKVRYKDGRVKTIEPGDDGSRALKVLWEDLKRSNELEKQKLGIAMDYLEKNGGPGYRKLRSALKSVARGLDRQSDARAEVQYDDRIRKLYRVGEVDKNGFVFEVVNKDLSTGASEEHIHEGVAPGISLSKLAEIGGETEARALSAIYDREEEIAFADARSGEDKIDIESDRHGGNYKIDLESNPPRIFILDYPLLGEIKVGQRDALFKLLGFIERFRSDASSQRYLIRQLRELLEGPLAEEGKLNRSSGKELEQTLRKTLGDSLQRNPQVSTADLVYEVIGEAESKGFEVHANVHDYLTALGNARDFSHYKKTESGGNALAMRIERAVRASFEGFEPRLNFREKCSYIWRKLLGFGSRVSPQ